MRKIGFTGKCPNGDITVLADQISRLKEVCVPYTIFKGEANESTRFFH